MWKLSSRMAGATERVRALLSDLPRHKAAPANYVPPAGTIRAQASSPARTYVATHSTEPPAGQIVTTETQNILLRQFHAKNDKRKKRAHEQGGGEQHGKAGKKRKSSSPKVK